MNLIFFFLTFILFIYCSVVSGFCCSTPGLRCGKQVPLCLPQTPEGTGSGSGSGSVQARAPETAGSVVVVCRPCGMWDLSSRNRDRTVSPGLEGVFLTIGPPGRSQPWCFWRIQTSCLVEYPTIWIYLISLCLDSGSFLVSRTTYVSISFQHVRYM